MCSEIYYTIPLLMQLINLWLDNLIRKFFTRTTGLYVLGFKQINFVNSHFLSFDLNSIWEKTTGYQYVEDQLRSS